MQPPPNNLDIVAAATAIFSWMVNPQLAVYIGPYFVIIVSAIAGAAWSLGRRPESARLGAAAYFVLMVLTAIVFTVPLSKWAASFVSWGDVSVLFGPVAFLIGGVGADWPSLVKWLLTRAGRIIERKAGGQHHD